MAHHININLHQDTCCICFESFDALENQNNKNNRIKPLQKIDNSPYMLPCNHNFHIGCIMCWFDSQLVRNYPIDCPICRYRLDYVQMGNILFHYQHLLDSLPSYERIEVEKILKKYKKGLRNSHLSINNIISQIEEQNNNRNLINNTENMNDQNDQNDQNDRNYIRCCGIRLDNVFTYFIYIACFLFFGWNISTVSNFW